MNLNREYHKVLENIENIEARYEFNKIIIQYNNET